MLCIWGPRIPGASSSAGWLKVLGRGGPARSWKEKGLEMPQALFQSRNRDMMLLSSPSQVGISASTPGCSGEGCPCWGLSPASPTTLPAGGCNCSLGGSAS